MQEPELARRLAAIEFFSGLTEAKRREIAGHIVQMKHSPGRLLTEQGVEGAGFHLILDGTADVEIGGEVRATLKEGDSFGEISLIDGEPRSATVKAGEDGLVTAALSPLAFAPLLDDPEVSKALLRVLTARLRAAESRSAES
jgi:CRP/FNR family transcriptional regulator, cyclic AMP receptor protein